MVCYWGHKNEEKNYSCCYILITFCFNRSPQTSSEFLRTSRELLLKELKELGYHARMKYNGEVVVDNIAEEDVVLVKKNHKLVIHLNKKKVGEKEKDPSESNL